MDDLQDWNSQPAPPAIVPDGGSGEALLIVTVEVVPGLSLGNPNWPLLAKTECQVWLMAGAAARERQAGLWKTEAEGGCSRGPICLPTSRLRPLFL